MLFSKHIDVRLDNSVVLETAKGLTSHDKPVMCALCYSPPRDSPAYAETDSGKGLEIIEQCLVDLYDITNKFHLFMCGDINARTNQNNGKFLSANARQE